MIGYVASKLPAVLAAAELLRDQTTSLRAFELKDEYEVVKEGSLKAWESDDRSSRSPNSDSHKIHASLTPSVTLSLLSFTPLFSFYHPADKSASTTPASVLSHHGWSRLGE